MPVSELDLIKAGLQDFRIDNLRVSRHAIERCRERHIPLEDLRRNSGNHAGYGVQRGNTIVTALSNSMKPQTPGKHGKKRIDEVKEEIRKRKEAIGLCKSVLTKSPSDYQYFRELLQHHPTGAMKKVSDIVDLQLVNQNSRGRGNRMKVNPGDLMFVAVYSDGTKDTISISKCIEPYLTSQ